MGAYHYINAIITPNEKWEKMKTIYDSCKDLGLDAPPEVWDFFDGTDPNENGVIMSMRVEELQDDTRDIFIISVKDIPSNAEHIEFIASY